MIGQAVDEGQEEGGEGEEGHAGPGEAEEEVDMGQENGGELGVHIPACVCCVGVGRGCEGGRVVACCSAAHQASKEVNR